MPNLATTLKEEIRRLAKKEIKAQTSSTKQAVSQYRREIAALKQRIREQGKKIAFLEKRERERLEEPAPELDTVDSIRFSPRWVKSQRGRLGLSAADYARLVGVSTLTVYNWEKGKNRPQAAQLAALASVRGIGKKEALNRLELLDQNG